jgi:hypothetical protein
LLHDHFDLRRNGRRRAKGQIKKIGEGKSSISKSEINLMRSDVAIGMAFSV